MRVEGRAEGETLKMSTEVESGRSQRGGWFQTDAVTTERAPDSTPF